MIRKLFLFILVILYGILMFGSLIVSATSSPDAISYRIHHVDELKNDSLTIQLYFEGTKGSIMSYRFNGYSAMKTIHDDTITKKTITYNYAGKNQAKIIGNIHGHLHNDCYGTLAYTDIAGQRVTTDITRVSTPNTAFYGAKATAYPNNGDYVANEIKKTANTAKDTSVTFYIIDLTDGVIYSYAYGAGNDRIIPFEN